MRYTPFKHYAYNKVGRDFVVGDIHGMFYALENLLKDLKFNPIIDRVFSVGDLIDRGPESNRILEFLDKPWFFSIMGNHEKMLIESENDQAMFRSWTINNGGDWWLNVNETEQDIIRERVKQLPLAGEIVTDSGTIGIVHADVPKGISWPDFIQQVENNSEVGDYILWSRNRYRHYQITRNTERVDGVDLIVLGHTPVKEPIHVSNICYLDTGAAYQTRKKLGRLSILEIQPKLKLYQVNTRKPRRPWL